MTLWVVGLFVIGLALIFFEAFLPGGVLGVTGVAAIIASCTLAVMHFPEHAGLIVAGETAAAIVMLILALSMLRHSPLGRLLTLSKNQTLDEGWVNAVTDASLVGLEGEVYTPLRPVGTVIVRGERMQAVAEGAYVPKGATVRVIEVHGNRVVVEEIEAAEGTE